MPSTDPPESLADFPPIPPTTLDEPVGEEPPESVPGDPPAETMEKMRKRTALLKPLSAENSLAYTRGTHVDLIGGDDAAIGRQLQWFPGAKRPVIGLRWGWGVQLADAMRLIRPDMSGLAKIIGPTGGKIIDAGHIPP